MVKMTRWTFRYGVAVLAVATAIALLLIPELGKGLGSILFLAVLIAASYGGLGPGLLATFLTTVVAILGLVFEPDVAPWRVVSIVLFVGGGVLITLLVEALHAARRRIEASQQWLAAVLTSIGDAVIATDARGRVTFINPVARMLTGWGSAEALGRPLIDIFRIVNEDTRAPVESPVDRVLRESIIVGLANHTVLISRDGTQRPIEDSSSPIAEKGGVITGVVLVFRDSTQRQHAEAVQARLAAIVESSDDAIIGKNLDGVITSWNAGAERIFGYAAEELVGRSIDLLIPADRRDEESETLARLRRGERVGHFDSARVTKDGRPIDVSTTVSPIRDGTGRLIGASRIFRDITEGKRAEDQLLASERMLAQSQRMAHVGSWELELDDPSDIHRGALRWSDECFRIFGYEPGQVAVTNDLFLKAVHPDDRNSVTAAVARALRKNSPFAIEHRIARPDGTERVVFESGEIMADSNSRPTRILGTCQDITERTQAEEATRELNAQLVQRLERISALRRIDLAISGSLDLRHTLDVVLAQVLDQLAVAAAAVLLVEDPGHALGCAASKGFRTGPMRPVRLPLLNSLAGRIALSGRGSPVIDLTRAPDDFTRADFAADEGFVAYTAIPLIAKGRVRGLMEVFHRTAPEPGPEWWSFFEALAGQAAIAIDNATLFEDLQHSNQELALAYDATIEGWSRVLDLRDHETEGHSRRVTDMTLGLARTFGMASDQLVHVRRGALLHDIGKLGIPDEILLKPGPLSDDEWQTMRLHPRYAFEWLSPVRYLRPALEIPHCHHERWDGTGYPRGLKGEEIPLEARIFAAVDILDALSHDRPYRKAWPAPQVHSHLRSLAGTHLDGRVVEVLLGTLAPDPLTHLN
jgi:PAS domain S-box-containing protein